MDDPTVHSALIPTLVTRFEHHHGLPKQLESSQNAVALTFECRRRLFSDMLEHCIANGKSVSILLFRHPALIDNADLSWLLDVLYPKLSKTQRKGAAVIIRSLWNRNDVAQTAHMYLALADPILDELLAAEFSAIEIDSECADQQRELLKRRRQSEEIYAIRESHKYVPDVVQKIEGAEEDIEKFWQLNLEMMVDQGGFHEDLERQVDIQNMAGWKSADADTRARIAALAVKYLHDGNPNDDHWIKDLGINYRPAQAGFRALYLLYKLSPELVSALTAEVFAKWAATIVKSNNWFTNIPIEEQHNFVQLVARFAPQEYPEAATTLLTVTQNMYDLDRLTQSLRSEWRPDFTLILWDKIDQNPHNHEFIERQFPVLLHVDPDRSTEFVANRLIEYAQDPTQPNQAAMTPFLSLMREQPSLGWEMLQTSGLHNSSFGEEALLLVANMDFHIQRWADPFSNAELGSLYRHLVVTFSFDTDPPIPAGSYSPTPRHEVARWRDSVMMELIQRANQESIKIIEQILEEFPNIPDASRIRSDARSRYLETSWQSYGS